jgi:hypothetical protein
MLQRTLEPTLKEAARTLPVVTITGPRQSGKTTLVRKVFPDLPYLTLEEPDTRARALADPRGFLRGLPDGAILDEVQRAADLLSPSRPSRAPRCHRAHSRASRGGADSPGTQEPPRCSCTETMRRSCTRESARFRGPLSRTELGPAQLVRGWKCIAVEGPGRSYLSPLVYVDGVAEDRSSGC